MRKLSFEGFLAEYVSELSFGDTMRLNRLAEEAETKNPRLREPLFLYAFFTGKNSALLSASKGRKFFPEYSALAQQHTKDSMLKALSKSRGVPDNYIKVWTSYNVRANRLEADNHTKELMRNKILQLQQRSKVSNYRIYTDLKLNSGNINAWLKTGEPNKISLDTARRIVEYVTNK